MTLADAEAVQRVFDGEPLAEIVRDWTTQGAATTCAARTLSCAAIYPRRASRSRSRCSASYCLRMLATFESRWMCCCVMM